MNYKIASKTCVSEDGTPHRFHYYLLTEIPPSPHFSCEIYGIHIEDDFGHTSTVQAITTSPTKIDELMTLLIDHCVGPSTLEEIVHDWTIHEKSGADLVGTAG